MICKHIIQVYNLIKMTYNFDSNTNKIKKESKVLNIDNSIFNFKITFSFKHTSFKGDILCFNNKNMSIKYYFDIIEYMKYLSSLEIEIIIKEQDIYKFHAIDFRYNDKLKYILCKILNLNSFNLPEICYFRATRSDYEKEGIAPRFIGFFETYGVFNIIFIDFNHQINPNKYFKNIDIYSIYENLYNIK